MKIEKDPNVKGGFRIYPETSDERSFFEVLLEAARLQSTDEYLELQIRKPIGSIISCPIMRQIQDDGR